jgi:hypothetical protein
MPSSDRMQAYLAQHAPDVVVLASLTYSRSQQLDQLKAARVLGIPVAAAIMSWDHLSSKALLHIAPDMVLVWNDVQRREAIEMHGLPAGRIVVTGAQCYDQWFTRQPARSRAAFCADMGLRADRPFVLWVHSAFSPQIEPPEPDLVLRWLAALRGSQDPALRELGVLIRPHPERVKEWNGVRLDRFDNVVFRGGNPIDGATKDDYFDALFHSTAVIGLATSAFLEAAIVGRPVLTMTPPEYRIHQEAMVHFSYLRTVAGGLLHAAPDIEGHLVQLAAAIAGGGERDERNRQFVGAFVRPAGLDVPGTPAFADAIEQLAASGPNPDPTLTQPDWMRKVAVGAASRTTAGVGQWLMHDRRADALEDSREHKRLSRETRIQARADARRKKVWRNRMNRAQHLAYRAAKEAQSAARKTRHRVAVFGYRLLAAAGIWERDLPDAGKD